MQYKKAASGSATIVGFSAASLLLGLCCAQAVAAPADILCEESDRQSASLEVPAEELSVSVVDHGTDDLVDDSPLGPMIPRTDTILRQIFDETLPADQPESAATPASAATAAPLAELTQPVQGESVEEREKADTTAVEEVDSMDTRLPGYAEDEANRYRRQMFRTDI